MRMARRGVIVAIVKGIDPETVAKAQRKMPQKDREAVGLVSMDLSDSMRLYRENGLPYMPW